MTIFMLDASQIQVYRDVPRPVLARLAAETARALQEPALQERFGKLGARLVGDTPEQFAKRIAEERARWGDVIRSAGIKLQ